MRIPKATLLRLAESKSTIEDTLKKLIRSLDRANGLSIVLVLDLLRVSANPALAVDCLSFLLAIDDRSEADIAEAHGVTRQAAHAMIKRLQSELGLPSTESMRSA